MGLLRLRQIIQATVSEKFLFLLLQPRNDKKLKSLGMAASCDETELVQQN